MSWKDFQIMLVANERSEINEWRRVRFMGWLQYVTNTTDKPHKKIEEWMPLPGDDKKDRGIPVDASEVVSRLNKMYGNGNP
jgi:hypothetical protein